MANGAVPGPSFDDRDDFHDIEKGFVAKMEPCVVHNKDGREVWNNDQWKFLDAECPPTVNPKLWRQAKLASAQGLYEVVPHVYQVRGLDLSNMTIIEGNKGIIVVDPLNSTECAREALRMYRQHRGDRPVLAVLYSHPHGDHFAGAAGVLEGTKDIPIIAPDGFMEEAVSENTFAGPAMRRRGAFMYGVFLPKEPEGQVGVGLSMTVSTGEHELIPPNTLIKETGEKLNIDGVEMVFQMIPETEAPVELNFFLPQYQMLYISECATHGMHNITTLRGAQVRNAKKWSKFLDETNVLFGAQSKALCAGHLWPTWGQEKISKHVCEQRDLYAYLHDQTVRMMNLGLNGTEIAESFELPPGLRDAWHAVGYYGSVSHNVKGIYQRYMTWFDGNPANLWAHTPVNEAKRYADCMGGVDQLVKKGNQYAADGDLRFAATLLDHAVNAEPTHDVALDSLDEVYIKLGYGCENGTWRNFYLTRAMELKVGRNGRPDKAGPRLPLNPFGSVEDWLGCLSIQLDGPKAAGESFAMFIHDPELRQAWKVSLSNGALIYRPASETECLTQMDDQSVLLSATKSEFLEVVQGNMAVARKKVIKGDHGALSRLLTLCGVQTTGDEASRL